MMKERGAFLVPTIATVMDLIDPGGDYDNPFFRARPRDAAALRETTAHAEKWV